MSPSFSLQPMVMTFVIDELIEAIMQEIIDAQKQRTMEHFQLLRTYCLLRPGTDDVLGDRILTALQEGFQKPAFQSLPSFIDNWLQQAREDSSSRVGYLTFNLAILGNMLGVC